MYNAVSGTHSSETVNSFAFLSAAVMGTSYYQYNQLLKVRFLTRRVMELIVPPLSDCTML